MDVKLSYQHVQRQSVTPFFSYILDTGKIFACFMTNFKIAVSRGYINLFPFPTCIFHTLRFRSHQLCFSTPALFCRRETISSVEGRFWTCRPSYSRYISADSSSSIIYPQLDLPPHSRSAVPLMVHLSCVPLLPIQPMYTPDVETLSSTARSDYHLLTNHIPSSTHFSFHSPNTAPRV